MKMKKIDITEIEGFRLGNAEDQDAGTGVTVIIADNGAVAGVDVRGGGPATRETDLLRSENTVDRVNAVVLSGGSAFGLEAASGVMKELSARGIGFKVGDIAVPIVPGASLFDLSVGRSDVYPDREMGREAVLNAYSEGFETGNHGAGTGASCGKILGMNRAMKTGLGTFACGDDVVRVGAVAAVNACADVYNGAGNIIAGLRTGDGSAILGSIKVLKEMIHPDEEPDLGIEDFRAGASSRFKRSSKPVAAEDNDAEMSDSIARDLMSAYEESLKETEADDPVITEAEAGEVFSPEQEDLSQPSDELTDEKAEPCTDGDTTEDQADSDSGIADIIDEEPAQDETETTSSEEMQSSEPDETDSADTDEDTQTSAETSSAEDPSDDEAVPAVDTAAEDEDPDLGYDIPFNTTIGCLITNAILTKAQANKLASIMHDAYARAVKPVHSTMDGDTIFVMSTCTQEVNFDAFAALATDVMQYAVIDGAQSAEGAYGLPSARDMIH